MFILHKSNKTENLLAHLTKVIKSQPLDSPFEKETFLIQSQGMERWLSQQLASRFRVWANYEFFFPEKFFNQIANKIGLELKSDLFNRETITWCLESLLRNSNNYKLGPIKEYLQGENITLKRFKLARLLAQLFDQYQIMRPDMLADWQKKQKHTEHISEPWQMYLWEKITERLGKQHRGALWLEAVDKLNQLSYETFKTKLPQRVSLFGINTMPPLSLAFLSALAKVIQVHLYLFDPTQTYWGDVQSKKQIAKDNLLKIKQNLTPDPVFITVHPLLQTMGQQGREFQEMLLEQVDFELELESYQLEQREKLTNLQCLQNDILKNQSSLKSLDNDNSISIHSCHSAMREVEVLKDLLLNALENNPSLELRDIVVMAPDIQVYEPFISAVFGDIQHSIADRSLRMSNNALDCFIKFLKLSKSRFGWQEVLDLLEQRIVYSGFGLSETDLDLIRYWVEETNIRWGQNIEHKKQLNLPQLDSNTWQAGMNRLFMGYAMGEDSGFVDGILPFANIEGTSARTLGGLNDFIQLLFNAGVDFSKERPLKNWAENFRSYGEKLFSIEKLEEIKWTELNELFAELSNTLEKVHSENVSLDVLIAWLENTFSERKSSRGFLRGQLTFCSILPMRSIPFKVIALLGINEGKYPKIDLPATFDLLNHSFRKGDRSKRIDDRYQFLEILLSAREQIIITYIGQSIKQNEEIPPSLVIEELLEVLEEDYKMTGLVTKHPLQPFSRRYFDGQNNLFSYSENLYETSLSITKNRFEVKSKCWWRGEIETEALTRIELNDFLSFFRNPQKYFVNNRLSLRQRDLKEIIEEKEPFQVNGLKKYTIDQKWVEELLNIKKQNFSIKKLQASGCWPLGTPGELLFKEQEPELIDFAEEIHEKKIGDKQVDISIDIQVNRYRLIGKLSNIYQHGSLIYRYTKLKGKDFIPAWLHHLIINQYKSQQTHLLTKDENIIFEPLRYKSKEELEKWITLYIDGQGKPSSFFVEPGLAYVQQMNKAKAKKSPIDAAIKKITDDINNEYEPEMSLLYRNLGDPGELLNEAFENCCKELLFPAWALTHE